MGGIAYQLHRLLKALHRDIVEQHRQNNSQREGGQGIQADAQRIADDGPEAMVGDKLPEVIQSDPGASQDSPHRLIPPEGNLHPVHGDIAEDNQVSQRDGHQTLLFVKMI